ncbi:hypothetical protein RMSM_04490 [Rhodopirellula maiorica SM1]|uniref:Uncharacterized protein n=1 Tax=Rhodopirellula maiorica SM1 TaxID=1265738 RepID=M5RHE1_9BACT|nr:hypothetical protein RMSM_04490 [Rhodopirellula maiorica SM1]
MACHELKIALVLQAASEQPFLEGYIAMLRHVATAILERPCVLIVRGDR